MEYFIGDLTAVKIPTLTSFTKMDDTVLKFIKRHSILESEGHCKTNINWESSVLYLIIRKNGEGNISIGNSYFWYVDNDNESWIKSLSTLSDYEPMIFHLSHYVGACKTAWGLNNGGYVLKLSGNDLSSDFINWIGSNPFSTKP